MQDPLQAALQHHQLGRLHDAARSYQAILARNPNHPDALHLLGVVAHQLGQHQQAAQLIGRAIALRPLAPACHANLAEVWRALGQFDKALECCRTALRLQPDYPEAANNLGLALLQIGEVAEAIGQFQTALRLRPKYAMAHNNLASVLRTQGDEAAAIEHFRQAVQCEPALAEAHSNLGLLLYERRQLPEALQHCQKAVELRPHFAEAHSNLGNVLREMGRLDDAYNHYAEALRIDPHSAEAHNGLGSIRQEQHRDEEAKAHYQSALQLKPDFAVAHCNLGSLLVVLNDLPGAEACFRAAVRHDPNKARAWAWLATMLRGKLPDEDLTAIRRQLEGPDLLDRERAVLHFSLAEALDARQQYAEAAEHLRQGNALALAAWRQSGEGYDPVKYSEFVSDMLAACTPAFFERVRGWGLDSERPVFIVGLPRSGTTLLEQILASHSQVFGAGELRLAREDFESLPAVMGSETAGPAAGPAVHGNDKAAMACLARIDRDAIHTVAGRHLQRLHTLDGTALRVVDKSTDNYVYLGLLATLFPKAKFIHCRRDLRDVAVSCWMTDFRQIPWANDLDHIASCFRDYRRLMEHWRSTLPVPVLDIDYEDTVADLESVARRLLAWCGLEWEPACLEFYQTQRPVRTASVTQVRKPVYTRSVARWKHYEAALAPLFAQLKNGP